MRILTCACAAVLLFVAAPAVARATPFDSSRVPASAEGVGHVDVDALRKTTLFKFASTKFEAHHADMDPKIRAISKAMLDSAQAVTFWMAEDTGAVIVKLSSTALVKPLLDQMPHKTVNVGGKKVERYTAPDDHAKIALVGDLLVVSGDEPSITRTVQVLTGKGKALAKGRVVAPSANGVFFFASLGDKLLDKVKKAAESQTLKVDMTALTVDVAEVNAELRARVRAVMATAENAQKVKTVVEGLLALASLAHDAQEIHGLLKHVQVTVSNKTLEIGVAMPSADLIKMAESVH
jgi:hypothetical protein